MTFRSAAWTPLFQRVKAAARGDVWVVGGFLRDALLGRPIADVDFAVQGDARGLADRFASAVGKKAFALDEARGTYRVALEEKGRTLSVDFARLQGASLAEDLARRDFTINALAWPLQGRFSMDPRKWVDLHGGRRDLAARRVAMIRPQAFKDDPLRLLRAYRFSAELDFSIAPATLKSIRTFRRRLGQSAPERVRDELMRVLSTPRGAGTFVQLDRVGLLTQLFPEGEPMRRTAHAYYGKGGVLKHSLAAMGAFEELLERLSVYFPRYHRRLSAFLNEPVGGHPRYALLKWVELFHDVGKPATLTREGKKLHFYGHDAVGARLVQKIARRFRFSSAEERSLTRMVGAHMRPGNLGNQPTLSERAIHRFFRDLENDAVSMLVVALGDHFTYLSEKVKRSRRDPVFVAIRTLLDRFFLKRDRVDPPKIIDGHQLMKRLKLAPGPVIGDLLNEIREAQAAGEVTTVDEALAVARRRLASTGTA